MSDFETTWELLVSTLKANAGTLGVEEFSIEEGKNEEPTIAPFVWVYCIPAVKQTSEAGAKLRRLKVSVFCGASDSSMPNALKAAVALAEKVEAVLLGIHGFQSLDIAFDDMYSDKTVVELTGFIGYVKSI